MKLTDGILEGDVLELDRPTTHTGRIFSTDIISQAIVNISKDIEASRMAGELDPLEVQPYVYLGGISHLIKELYIQDGFLKAKAQILKHGHGRVLSELDPNSIRFSLRAVARVGEDMVVWADDFKIISIDIIKI